MTNNRTTHFFVGSWAGCIGHTESGYPIHDYFIVEMVTYSGRKRFFQFHELRGVEVAGKWKEAQLETEKCVSSDDTVYDCPIWKFEGKEVPEEKLVKKYDIVEITDLVIAAKKYAENTGYNKSPYVNLNNILGNFSATKIKLDGRFPQHKGISQAMKDYIKTVREM